MTPSQDGFDFCPACVTAPSGTLPCWFDWGELNPAESLAVSWKGTVAILLILAPAIHLMHQWRTPSFLFGPSAVSGTAVTA